MRMSESKLKSARIVDPLEWLLTVYFQHQRRNQHLQGPTAASMRPKRRMSFGLLRWQSRRAAVAKILGPLLELTS